MVSALDLNWRSIAVQFWDTDISDSSFRSKYEVNTFQDPSMQTMTLYYEAKDEQLVTQVLQVVVDLLNKKIKSIYINHVLNINILKILNVRYVNKLINIYPY